ncbi:hypothetical protein, partial [Peribacillus simplex]|uniref:hypothetical protein n=1 Tax=Peribacillus simplex TaxID=1478 RepID=UPI001629CFD7
FPASRRLLEGFVLPLPVPDHDVGIDVERQAPLVPVPLQRREQAIQGLAVRHNRLGGIDREQITVHCKCFYIM